MTRPVVSVIMPIYNAEKYLEEAIESILNQTFTNFELIIINDGSTDRSLNIITKYQKKDCRIVLISRENRGLISSLNEGLNSSKGKYVARMDGDDISCPSRFELQVNLLEEGYDICGCHYDIINENGKLIDSIITPTSSDGFLITLSQTVPFAHGSVMFRVEFLKQYKLGYCSSAAEDYLLWVKFFQNDARMANVGEVMFKYRKLGNSLSHQAGSSNVIDAYKISKAFIKRYKDSITKSIEESYGEFTLVESEHAVVTLFYLLLTFRLPFRKWYLIKHFPIKYKVNGFLKAIHLIFKFN